MRMAILLAARRLPRASTRGWRRLADNGGPTQTHALLANSPAINSGDPSAAAGVNDVPFHDQRQAPFIRVYAGRIDMGAYELQPIDRIAGDFNGDGSVDTADYVVWRKTLGSTITLLADADGNGVVDEIDRAISLAHFGYVSPQKPIAGLAAVAEAETATSVSESSEKSSNDNERRTRLQNRQAVLDEAFAALTSRTMSKSRRSRFAS